MINNLKIEKKPFAVTKHYNGTYYSNSQWEDEITTETYNFTIEVTDYSEGRIDLDDITWNGEVPRDVDAAELYLNEHYLELIIFN